MALHSEFYRNRAMEDEEARKQMIERNHRKMEELAKEQPSPTPEEVARATTPRTSRETKVVEPVKEPEQTKTVEPEPMDEKGTYKTRGAKK